MAAHKYANVHVLTFVNVTQSETNTVAAAEQDQISSWVWRSRKLFDMTEHISLARVCRYVHASA